MAARARHVLMSTLQRKRCSAVMVEIGRLPTIEVVATRTIGHIPAAGKLAAVGVGMASRTLLAGCAKVHVFQRCFKSGRAMTIDTCHAPVRAEKRKVGLGVIEAIDFLPLSRGMARLATLRRPVRALGRHAIVKLVAVRVRVARGAGTVLIAEFHCRLRPAGWLCVTLRARHRQMRAR